MNLIDICKILGSLQAFILAVIFFLKRKRISLLCIFLFILSIYLISTVSDVVTFLIQVPYLLALINPLGFLFGPLFYWYIRSMLQGEYNKPRLLWLHLAPFVIEIGWYIIMFSLNSLETIRDITIQSYYNTPVLFISIFNVLKLISGCSYCFACFFSIWQFKDHFRLLVKKPVMKRWLISLLIIFSFCWVIVLFSLVISSIYTTSVFLSVLVVAQYLSFIIFLYVLTFFTISHPQLFSRDDVRTKIKARLHLNKAEINNIKDRIQKIMKEDKVYQDSVLTLQKLSAMVGVHFNVLSFVINDEYHTNFNSFINDFKLDHFIELIKSKQYKTKSLLELSFDSGFTSKTSFNRVFKKKYFMSPSRYIEIHKE